MIRIAALDSDEAWIEAERNITDGFFGGDTPHLFHGYTTVESFLFDMEGKPSDIYLLDMELPQADGLEIAKKIRMKYYYAWIIYVTDQMDYAADGYEVNAFRFIAKDNLQEKLTRAYEALLDELAGRKSSYFTLENSRALIRIPEDDIYYLEKEDKYVIVKYRHGEERVRMTLEEALKKLDPKAFMKINKSMIVNFMYVQTIVKHKAKMQGNFFLPISQAQLENAKRGLAEFWRSL